MGRLEGMELIAFLQNNKVLVGVGLLGLFFMVLGVVLTFKPASEASEVEIVAIADEAPTEAEEAGDVVIDVGGAVERPGVYALGSGARVNDALMAAGGLAGDADRVWVARNVNLAAQVTDGMKLYVPVEGEMVVDEAAPTVSGAVAGAGIAGKAGGININTASASELDSLWGIGEARAADIIANRPYASVEELMSKAGIPQNVFERIQGEVGVH